MRPCLAIAALAAVVAGPSAAKAQPAHHSGPYATGCLPVAERAGREVGCWITAKELLGELPPAPPLLWHLDAYPSRAAAEAAKGPRGTVVESLGRVWLFTVAEAGWRPPPGGGERVAAIGPLPTREGVRYAAQYMEGVSPPSAQSNVHRHPGPEAWYNVTGRLCVETPEGRIVAGPEEGAAFVPENVPHMLTGLGTEQRRSLVIILHDVSHPASAPAPDWTPRGLCRD